MNRQVQVRTPDTHMQCLNHRLFVNLLKELFCFTVNGLQFCNDTRYEYTEIGSQISITSPDYPNEDNTTQPCSILINIVFNRSFVIHIEELKSGYTNLTTNECFPRYQILHLNNRPLPNQRPTCVKIGNDYSYRKNISVNTTEPIRLKLTLNGAGRAFNFTFLGKPLIAQSHIEIG